MPESSGQKWIQVRVDDDFKRVAKMAAAADGKQISAYVRGLIDDDVEEKGISLPDAPSN
jgi:predicted HicB family RNase H-like nuclease